MLEETKKAIKNKKNGGYQCNVCLSVFVSKRTIKYHQENGHLDTKLNCDICGLSLNSNMAFLVHKKFHAWEKDTAEKQHLNPVYECSLCDLKTRSPRSLVFHHQENHRSYNRFSNITTSKRKSFSRVLCDENQNEILKCTYFDFDWLLNKVRCPLCCVSYGENRIKGHFMTAHPFHKSLFCTHCAAIIENQDEMVTHLLQHTQGGDLHKCDICGSLYISGEAVAAHRRLHTSQRPFFCSVCQKKFQSKIGAIAHFYSHLKIEMLRDSDEDLSSQNDENSVPFQAGVNEEMLQTNLNVQMPHSDLNVAMSRIDNSNELTSQQRDDYCITVMEDSEDFVNVWD